jgi:ABC-type phosphate transport system substrate-binding protein
MTDAVTPGKTFALVRLCAFACLLVAVLSCGAVRADSIAVITGPDHAGATPRDVQLRAMFAMRIREWPDGTPVRVFVLPDNDPTHAQFCRELLGTYPYVMRTVWDRLVYTGTGVAPETVRSEAEMRARVAATKGAVGYVRADQIEQESQTNPSVASDKGKAAK